MSNFYGQYVGFGADGTGGVSGYVFQGSAYGYHYGGYSAPSQSDVIDKFSFSSDGNATDHGDGYWAAGTGNMYQSSHQV